MATPGFQFDDSKHEYSVNGVLVPSVTQALDEGGLVSYDNVSPEVLEKASKIGVYVHRALEYLDQGKLDFSSLHPTLVPYVRGYQYWKEAVGFKPEMIERQGVAVINGMRVGYTLDRAGTAVTINRKFVVEIKSTAIAMRYWGVQTAGYKLCVPELKTYERMAIHLLGEPEKDPSENFRVYIHDDEAEETVFLSALVIATWKRNATKSGGRA